MSGLFPEAEKTKAAGAGTQAALKNPTLDYAPMGDLVQANIDGQRTAADVLAQMKTHFADPDTLYLALKAIGPDCRDIRALTRMRGFMRILQKRIERSEP